MMAGVRAIYIMPDISIYQEGENRITLGNKDFEAFDIFYFEASAYVSNRGILLFTNGGGERKEEGSVILSWGKRILKINDKVTFTYKSCEEQTDSKDWRLHIENLEIVDPPKVAFLVTLPNNEIVVCDNLDYASIQLDLRWDNISNECSLNVFSSNVRSEGELDTKYWVSKVIEEGQFVILEIQALTKQ